MSRIRTAMRRPILLAALAAALAAPAAAAEAGDRPAAAAAPLERYAYTLKHQQASEALAAIQPLLSGRGTVELRQTDNTLVVRDTRATLRAIAPALQRFDHPIERLRVEVSIIRARRASFSPILQEEPLPELLARRLKELLPYSTYSVLAHTELPTEEGEEVTYELGEGFGVRFRTGTLVEGTRIKLHDFRIARSGAETTAKTLLHGSLSLQLGRTFTTVLTGSEGSANALVVVLVPRRADEAD